jgi:hypothetical protein
VQKRGKLLKIEEIVQEKNGSERKVNRKENQEVKRKEKLCLAEGTRAFASDKIEK